MGFSRRRFLGAAAIGFGIPLAYSEATGKTFPEIQAEILEGAGVEELPANALTEYLLHVPPDYQSYITPGNDTVEFYSENSVLDLEDGKFLLEGGDFSYDTGEPGLTGTGDWNRPEEYLESREGDCDDHALAMASLMEERGNDSMAVIGAVRFPLMDEKGVHAHCQTRVEDDYYVLDVSWPDRVFERERYIEDRTLEWEPLWMFGDDESLQLFEEEW